MSHPFISLSLCDSVSSFHLQVDDPCGRAGGTTKQHAGPGVAVFATTKYATQGDLGSKVLKPAASGTTWRAGDAVEVSWGIRYTRGEYYSVYITVLYQVQPG